MAAQCGKGIAACLLTHKRFSPSKPMDSPRFLAVNRILRVDVEHAVLPCVDVASFTLYTVGFCEWLHK